jgi:MFS transporter, ACS family, hexuronate transporter
VWSLAGLSSGMVSSLFGLGASRFVLGLFEAGHWPCALRTTQRIFKPEERTWGNSVLQSGASLGAVITPLLVVGLYNWEPGNWRWTFFLIGGLGIPWAVWWLFTVRESDVRRPVIQTDESAKGSGTERELQEIPFWKIFTTRRWWILLFVVICINTVWHYIRVWMPTTLEKDHGYSHEFVGYFTSLYYLATFFGSLASGLMTARLVRKGRNVHSARLTTFLVFAIMSSFAIPAAFLPTGYGMLACLLVVAFGSLGLFPVYYSLNQEISAKNQGKVGGSLGFSTWSILFFVHPAVGHLVEADPTIRPYLFAGTAFGPLLAYLVLRKFWGARPVDESNQLMNQAA